MLRLWIPIVPEHIWSKIPGDKAATYNSVPPVIGSGPFQVVEVKKGSYIRFAANKDYWKGAPKVDEVILRDLHEPGHHGDGPQERRHRRRRRPARCAVQRLEERTRHHGQARPLPVLRGAGDERLRQRRLAGEPRASRPQVPAGDQLGGRQGEDHRHGPQRLRGRRPVDHRAVHRRRLDADAGRDVRLRHGKGGPTARRRRLQGLERRRRQGGQEGQTHQAAALDPERVTGAAERRQTDRGLLRGARPEHRPERRERRHDQRRHLRLQG